MTITVRPSYKVDTGANFTHWYRMVAVEPVPEFDVPNFCTHKDTRATAFSIWRKPEFASLQNATDTQWDYDTALTSLIENTSKPVQDSGVTDEEYSKLLAKSDYGVLTSHLRNYLFRHQYDLWHSRDLDVVNNLPFIFWSLMRNVSDWGIAKQVLRTMPTRMMERFLLENIPLQSRHQQPDDLKQISKRDDEWGRMPRMWMQELFGTHK